ncbi:MAG: hypothetical protein NC899_03630 [Candidatus Omnitrophica bacterium]|nr:hypothetical protein [Candidatus Omnitrophota bacterium]
MKWERIGDIFALIFFLISGLMIHSEPFFELPIEAEDFRIIKGWKVSDYGYFPSQPNLWSGTKIIADETDQIAIAFYDFEVPEEGEYALWVRYESCYGFGSLFKILIEQEGEKSVKIFGSKQHEKYFPFGYGLKIQGPWIYHNTDYVYQAAIFKLKKNKARIYLIKDVNEKPSAKRVIDFLYITNDLNLKPQDDWQWIGKKEPPIISRFSRPLFLKINVVEGDNLILKVGYEWWLMGYYKGPKKALYFTKKGLIELKPGEKLKDDDKLKKGFVSKWEKIDINPVMPPVLIFNLEGNGKVNIEVSFKNTENIIKKMTVDNKKEEWLIVGIGKERYEKGILGSEKALTFEEFLKKQIKIVDDYKVKGKKVEKIFLGSAIRSFPYLSFQLAKSCGMNCEFYGTHPEIYGKEPIWTGFNTSIGFITLQNIHLKREFYEGKVENLEKIYEERWKNLKKVIGKDLPVYIKLIEESGPPAFQILGTWDIINEKFKSYMSENGYKGYEKIGTGSPEEAEKNPVLFYHSWKFRAKLFTEVCKKATELIEKIFPDGTKTTSGSIYISTGGFPAIEHGYEVFDLFKNRGVTAYSSETSWGLGGTPDYIGAQTQSFEGAIARSLSKYHNIPMGAYLISDGNRGYTGDFIELASYALFSQGFNFLQYYDFGYPSECSFIGHPDILKGIKRTSYTIGEIEDYLLDGKVIDADIAIIYSETTNIWDNSVKIEGEKLPGNTIYPQERQNLYYILRHLHYPCDIVCEDDIMSDYIYKYKVLIFIGDHIQRKVTEKLEKWVSNGGFLISVAGGPFYDEYNKEIELMKRVFGIEEFKLEKKQHFMRPKLDLLHTENLDTISFNEILPSFNIYAYRQSFIPKEGKPMGYFKNGEVACVMNNYGKGKTFIIGGLPGISYLENTFPLLPYGRGGIDELSNYIPSNFNSKVREIFEFFLKDINKPIEVSHFLVEPVIMKSLKDENIYYVSLINFSGKSINNLSAKINIDGIKDVKTIFSKYYFKDKNLIVQKIDKLEFLILKKGSR